MNLTPTIARRQALALSTAGLLWALAGCASAPPVDAQAAIQKAEAAMGGVGLKTLRFAGTGTGGVFGQAWQPELPWPKVNYSAFSRVVDYENSALREESARTRAEPNGGGALPLMGTGEQRQIGLLQGRFAWNLAGTAAAPAPVAMEARAHDLWTTPHGVLKAALRNKATAVSRSANGKTYNVVSFTEPGLLSATAWINADTNLVERIESVHPSPVMGDTQVLTTFGDYKDYNGLKFPTTISQTEGGSAVYDLRITEVQAGVPTGFVAPDNVRNFTENVTTEKVAEGVWFLAGGSHNSVAIEMKDHLIVVETPLYDGRAAAVLAAARKLSPKPIRLVINSHHHFDHAGGLRAAVAEGIPLLTSALAKPWFERAFANPNRVAPDLLAKSGRSASIEGYTGKRVISDGSRTVEVMEIRDSVHAQGFNMVYLPAEKLLIEADAYTPGAPNSPAPNPLNGNNVNLADNIDKLGLQVERILPLHGRVATIAELRTYAGRK